MLRTSIGRHQQSDAANVSKNDARTAERRVAVRRFITSQAVADLVHRIRAAGGGPLEACRRVVAEAYRLWLQYEVRSDDITIVCVFFDDLRPVAAAASSPAAAARGRSPGPMSDHMTAARDRARAREGGGCGGARTSTETRPATVKMKEVRPVRRVLAKEKRLHLNLSEGSRSLFPARGNKPTGRRRGLRDDVRSCSLLRR